MDTVNNLLTGLPTALVLGYFLNRFLKNLDDSIIKVNNLSDRIIILENEIKWIKEINKK